MRLNAVNDEGAEFKLLAPFFRALMPVFAERPDEIRIESGGSRMQARWGDKNASLPLKSRLHGYAAIAFSRILILSAMDIALEGVEQTGRLRVRYGGRFIPIQVKSRRDDGSWHLVFRPAWEAAQPIS
jgi:hypothetical protein